MRKTFHFVRRHVCAAVVVVAFVPQAARAQRNLEITSFDAELAVMQSGRLHVTEHITAHFSGQWNGLYRMIPVRYAMTNGTDYLIGLHIDDVRDELGHALRREETREGSYLKIKAWIPGATDATHTLILRYTVDNALRFFDEHDELYWNVTGNGWEYPINSVTARVIMPDGVKNIRSGVYTGREGATGGDAIATQVANGTQFATTQPLLMHEGLTIVEGWEPGVVARPSAFTKFLHFAKSNAFMLIPLLTLLLMQMLWRKYGKDPEIGTITPRYDPPDNLSPAETGTVIDMSVDHRDISATLVDLAVRGHIRINEVSRGKLLGFSLGTEYTIERLTAVEEHAKLREHERLMLEGLFAKDPDVVSMDSLRNTFYTTLSAMKVTVYNGMMKAGYFKQDPQIIRLGFVVLGVAAFFGVFALGARLAVHNGLDESDIVVAAALTAIAIAGVGFIMPRRTIRGIQMVRQVMGFEEFLGRVEGERMRTVIDSPELFEKYLPYAIALGVDEQWAAQFAGLSMPPPRWYGGSYPGGAFQPHQFVQEIGHMTTSVNSTFESSPRSSSSSGFSGGSGGGGGGGGGSSGGGFGGGGGGGF